MLQKLIQLLKAETNRQLSPDFNQLSLHNQFRALCNLREPKPASNELLGLQDKYLQEQTKKRGIIDVQTLDYEANITLWQGDITRLNSYAIVNACNAQLLGCFSPLHNCIDNVIHTNAGIQVRLDCNNIMQGKSLPTGKVKVTKAYNLPSQYIFHTVGPIVGGRMPSESEQNDLKNCYLNSLNLAKKMNLKTIAFCGISTGVYGYPKNLACDVAIETVKKWLQKNDGVKVIFNTFLDEDFELYQQKLKLIES